MINFMDVRTRGKNTVDSLLSLGLLDLLSVCPRLRGVLGAPAVHLNLLIDIYCNKEKKKNTKTKLSKAVLRIIIIILHCIFSTR